MAACRRHDFAPRVSQRANSIETMLGLVRSGFGVAPAPWSAALRPPPGVDLVRITPDHHRIVCAHRADSGNTALIEVFIGVMTGVITHLLSQSSTRARQENRDDSEA